MKANLHTHTWRCKHAKGTEREYIERAIEEGMQCLGFSDHAPQVYPIEYDSPARMYPDQLEDYVRTLEDLKKEYAGQIDIHIGLEAEHMRALFEPFLRLIEDYPIEYLILGQHYTYNEYDGSYTGHLTRDPMDLEDYCAQTMEGLKSGKFLYLAHPDLINFEGDEALYRRKMEQLCLCAIECRVPVEINLLGLNAGRNYPNPIFWEIAGKYHMDTVLGMDAHRPQDVIRPEAEKKALEMIDRYGLSRVDEWQLIKSISEISES